MGEAIKKNSALLVGVLLLLPLSLCGQTCLQLLGQMEDQYKLGSLITIPDEMSACLRRRVGVSFTKEENIRARRLVILSHLFTDNQATSEEAMVALLRLDPEHVFDEASDPKEIFYLYGKFRTTPIYRFGFYGMGNYSIVNSLQSYGVENTAQTSEQAMGSVLGGVGVSVEKHFPNFFEIFLNVQASFRSFSLRNDLYDYSYYELTETHLWFDMPIGARFFLSPDNRRWSFQPYLHLGWMPSLLFSANLSGVRQGGAAVNLGSLSFLEEQKRKPFTHSVFFGMGFKYRLSNRKNFFIVDLSYVRNNTNLVQQKNRYLGNQDLHFRLGYVDDNFSLDALQVSFGFIFSVYNPKKLKKYREE